MGRWLPCFVLGYSLISNRVLAEPLKELNGVRSVCRAGVENAIAGARRARGEAGVLAAEVLPNPALIVEHQRALSGPTDRETILGLSVPLGISGRRWLLQDAAEARRKQLTLEARAGLFEAALAFREAYVVATIAQARVEILTTQQAALEKLTSDIQKLAKGGEAASYDQLRQATYARLHGQALESATADALSSRAQLQAWLDREVTLPADATTVQRRNQLATPPASDTAEVQGLEAEARADDLDAQAARRRAVPDVSLFGGYRATAAGSETGHGIALSLELPITIFDHGQGEATRASADAQLARATAQRLRKRQRASVRAAQMSLQRLEASTTEAEATTRDAVSIRDKATQLYSAGEANITELLEAYRFAEEAQLAELALSEKVAQTRLGLMRAAGTMFDAELDRNCSGGAR